MSGSPVERQHWPRLQFSLRVVIAAFTAFAIGFPVWYRRPYQDSGSLTNPEGTRITTWRRQWGGNPLRHGPERVIRDGTVRVTTTYRDGRKYGPYVEFDSAGQPEYYGQYVNGKAQGLWVDRALWTDNIQGTCRSWWHEGRRHGPLYMDFPDGKAAVALFQNGRLTHLNGEPISNRLADLIEQGRLDEDTAETLKRNVALDWNNEPGSRIAGWGASWGLPIVVDPLMADVQEPITERVIGIDLCSALSILTETRGLSCDYRYGCVWVTTHECATGPWRDPTGVSDAGSDIGSILGSAWDAPINFNVHNEPLATALRSLARRAAISIDVSHIEAVGAQEPYHVTFDLDQGYVPGGPPRSLKDVLSMLLYQTACRCSVKGETLVVLPPEAR